MSGSMAQANNNTVLDHGINESDDAGDHNLSKVPPDNSIATEADPPVRPQRGPTIWNPNRILKVNEFRGLMGIPLDEELLKAEPLEQPIVKFPAPIDRPHTMPKWLRRVFVREDAEAPTSIYYSLIGEERKTRHRLRLYNWIVYGGLISQLILAAALIILGARGTTNSIAIATIGAGSGVIAGILSILKGQGLPVRLVRFADSLRRVRSDIDFHERQLRMNLKMVTLGDAIALRDDYEMAFETRVANHPDNWQSGGASAENKTVALQQNLQKALNAGGNPAAVMEAGEAGLFAESKAAHG